MGDPGAGRDRLVRRTYPPDRRRPVLEELAYLRLLHGWRARSRYVGGYVFTGADYAQKRRRTGLRAQLRYLWSKLRA
jgi:hypothetical protein